MTKDIELMEKLVSLCKRRGFIYQGSEIYGGLAGMWDYGPLGVALKNNIKNLWWKRFVLDRTDMYGMDAAILMNQNAWKASGHVDGFADPLVECPKCHRRFRADQIENDKKDGLKHCPNDKQLLGPEKQFNMMLKTSIGAIEDENAISYLRPETAGGMFVNFKNIIDSFHPRLPFGTAQIGKAFRNEIAPRDFIFRTREFEQMEIEYFVKPAQWEESFEAFRKQVLEYTKDVGLPQEKVHEREIAPEDRAHYSKRTIDFEFDFPFGRNELSGLVYRADFDLKAHSVASGVDLSYQDEEAKERYTPHVIEPSFGVDRMVLAVLADAYREDVVNDEPRVYLALSPNVAPVKAAVFPLLKNKPELVKKAEEIFSTLKKQLPQVMFDDNGNIGKRYRRQDEIGTPYCITVDFDTLTDNMVTIRERNSGKQERVAISDILSKIIG